MSLSAPQQFTASQIARALGKQRQAVQRLLRDVTPTGSVVVGGNVANAWTMVALPSEMQKELEARAWQRGCRNAEHLLASPGEAWQPSLPISEIAQHSIDAAAKLQRALQRVLVLQNDLAISSSELERVSIEDYKREFGHAVSARYLRELIRRTLDRAGGGDDFSRLELFLDERPARKSAPRAVVTLAVQNEFRELLEVSAAFKNPGAPSDEEKNYLWLRAFELLEEKAGDGSKFKKVKKSLVKFLVRNASFLAESAEAMRVAFNRKYARWIESDRAALALEDKRGKNSGFFRADRFLEEDIARVQWEAGRKYRGDVLPAARALIAKGDIRDKNIISWGVKGCDPNSHIYRRLLGQAGPAAKEIQKYSHDENADLHFRPYMTMDWSRVPSMFSVSVDDFTLEVKMRVPDGDGWWRLTRGQCILTVCDSTLCALQFGLTPEEAPNSLVARTTLMRTFQEHGIPEHLVLERGKVFADSTLVGGGIKARRIIGRESSAAFSDAEVSLGLRRFCKVHISKRPQSKSIERVGDLIQNLMSGEPGWTGKEERYDLPQETKKWTLELERKNPDALEHFYTLEQWCERLKVIVFEIYNNKPHGKNSRKIPGESPLEAFKRKWSAPREVPEKLRFLLSHHKIENVPVTDNGVTLTIRGKRFRYFDAQTGYWKTFIGKPVTAWIDPEAPEFCTFTDNNMENPFTVPLHTGCVPHQYDDHFREEMAKAQSHASVGKRLYAGLKRQPWAQFPRISISPITANAIELGRHIEAKKEETKETQQRQAKARKAFGRLGMALPSGRPLRPGQAEAAEDLAKLLAEEESQ